MAAWFTSMDTLYAEFMRRLQNIDDAYELGLYDSEDDRDAHKMRMGDWYLEMSAIMQPTRAAA
jgi:hypothetical protein